MPSAITLRLTTADPVPGVAYSLQDKANAPVDPRIADDGPISFDVPVTLSDDIPADLLALARDGRVLEVILPGRARDRGPACATVRRLQPWRAV